MKILLFTHSFPSVSGEVFLRDELDVITKVGSVEVTIAPLVATKDKLYYSSPVLNPIFNLKDIFKALANPRGYTYLFSKDWLKMPIQSLKHFLILKLALSNKNLLKEIDSSDILYFYWGVNSTVIAPFFPGKIKVSRFHGYDLYDDGPYMQRPIPFRAKTLRALNYLFPVSQMGVDFLSEKKWIQGMIKLQRLGVFGTSDFGPVRSKGIVIVSCSRLVSLKRVELIIEALRYSKDTITWTHFGDGPLMESLISITSDLPRNIRVNLMGNTERDAIIQYYKKENPALFVNVSTTEGVPVSAMEALSCGIPLLMTDVGGSKELIDTRFGRLVSQHIIPEELSREITQCLENFSSIEVRKAAKDFWKENYNADKNYIDFYKFLKEVASK